jgi:hypothetical protein
MSRKVRSLKIGVSVFLILSSLGLFFIKTKKEIEGTIIEKYSNVFGHKICIYNSYEKSCYSISSLTWEKIEVGEDVFIECSLFKCTLKSTIIDIDLLSKKEKNIKKKI